MVSGGGPLDVGDFWLLVLFLGEGELLDFVGVKKLESSLSQGAEIRLRLDSTSVELIKDHFIIVRSFWLE